MDFVQVSHGGRISNKDGDEPYGMIYAALPDSIEWGITTDDMLVIDPKK